MVATPFSLVGSIGGALGSLGSCQPGFTDLITLDLLMICCFPKKSTWVCLNIGYIPNEIGI